MKQLWMLALLAVFLLAACGGDGDNGDQSASNDNDTPAPVAQTSRNYSIQISGDFEGSIPPGAAQAEFYPGRYELFFGDMSHNLFFTLSEDVRTGTHALEASDIMASSQNATVEFSMAVNPESISEGMEDYDDEVTGTITLDTIGDTMSGSFEFAAVFVDTDDNQQETRKSVTVIGTFTDLAVQRNE